MYTKNKIIFISFDLETGGERCGIIQMSALYVASSFVASSFARDCAILPKCGVFKALHLTMDTGYHLSDTFPSKLKHSTFILRGDLALER